MARKRSKEEREAYRRSILEAQTERQAAQEKKAAENRRRIEESKKKTAEKAIINENLWRRSANLPPLSLVPDDEPVEAKEVSVTVVNVSEMDEATREIMEEEALVEVLQDEEDETIREIQAEEELADER